MCQSLRWQKHLKHKIKFNTTVCLPSTDFFE